MGKHSDEWNCKQSGEGKSAQTVFCLECSVEHRIVVAEGYETYACLLEVLLRNGEAVREERNHADDFASCVADSLDSLKRAFACRNEVFDDYYFLTALEITLDKVLESVVLGSRTDVCERKVENVSDKRALGDSARCYAGNSFCLREFLEDDAGELGLDVCPDGGVGQCAAVVGVDRRVPARSPREGVGRLDRKSVV